MALVRRMQASHAKTYATMYGIVEARADIGPYVEHFLDLLEQAIVGFEPGSDISA